MMTDFLSTLWAGALPAILQLIGAVLGLVLIRLSAAMKTRWGIEIEARQRETLHSALMTGITAALSRGLSGKDAVSAAVAYVLDKGAPEAADALGADMQALHDMAQAKLGTIVPSGGA